MIVYTRCWSQDIRKISGMLSVSFLILCIKQHIFNLYILSNLITDVIYHHGSVQMNFYSLFFQCNWSGKDVWMSICSKTKRKPRFKKLWIRMDTIFFVFFPRERFCFLDSFKPIVNIWEKEGAGYSKGV